MTSKPRGTKPSVHSGESTEGHNEVTFSVAVSGKGGTGKTTVSALIIRALVKKGKKPVLAVDADPNSNLNESLGIPLRRTVGEIRERLLERQGALPPEQTKEDYLNYMIQSSLTESDTFDLLAMGRPEGPGCYCYVNNVLRKIVDSVTSSYPYVVMDTEAGMEHFSRRTTRDLDVLIIATDPTVRGITTAKRIAELVKELDTKVGRMYAIANRVPESLNERVRRDLQNDGLECLGVVPEDELVREFEAEGKPIYSLPETSRMLKSVTEMVDKLTIP
jgi:CO dehydrogenase maturation factor